MMSERPATKADLETFGEAMKADAAGLREEFTGLRSEFTGLRGEFAGLRGEMESEFKAVRAEMATKTELSDLREEMKSEFKAVRTEIGGVRRGLALQIERLQSDLRASEGRMMREMGALRSAVVDRLESFAGRMKTIWRESILTFGAL
ncbi:MAG TPA: hypothetical protein DCZ01_09700, partial [Elusimicrobia bacterium]|nr:hypothetical protein [Elusimicrobiota bacterium]